jgi:hypothetical protein
MVLSSNYDVDGSIIIRVIVDLRTPNVWREEPYFEQIKTMAMRGLTGKATDPFKTLIVIGNSRCAEVTWEVVQSGAHALTFSQKRREPKEKERIMQLPEEAGDGAGELIKKLKNDAELYKRLVMDAIEQ